MLTKIKSNICAFRNLDLPALVKGGQLILITSPGGGGDSERLKKGWKYGAGAGLLKRRGLVLLFSFFKVYHFEI